jgi:hypothetical protein
MFFSPHMTTAKRHRRPFGVRLFYCLRSVYKTIDAIDSISEVKTSIAWTLPQPVDTKISGKYNREREKDGKERQ